VSLGFSLLLLGVYRRDQHSSVAGINLPLLLGSTHLPRDYEILFRGSDDLLSGEDELRFDEERRTTLVNVFSSLGFASRVTILITSSA